MLTLPYMGHTYRQICKIDRSTREHTESVLRAHDRSEQMRRFRTLASWGLPTASYKTANVGHMLINIHQAWLSSVYTE